MEGTLRSRTSIPSAWIQAAHIRGEKSLKTADTRWFQKARKSNNPEVLESLQEIRAGGLRHSGGKRKHQGPTLNLKGQKKSPRKFPVTHFRAHSFVARS